METLEKVTRRIEGKLNSEVWSGKQKGTKVAIKFLQRITDESLAEIKKELSFLGTFRHERIISHLEFVEGKTKSETAMMRTVVMTMQRYRL